MISVQIDDSAVQQLQQTACRTRASRGDSGLQGVATAHLSVTAQRGAEILCRISGQRRIERPADFAQRQAAEFCPAID